LRTQTYFRCRSYSGARALLGASIAVSLSGCWIAPNADIRPPGEPRVIAGEVEVEGVASSAKVESVDRAARILVLSVNGVPLSYGIGRRVRNWDDLHTGDTVKATLRDELTIYVAPPHEKRSPDAHVLLVNPSYRVMEVQYANGRRQTLKVALLTQMKGIGAGDAITIHPVEVIKLHLRHDSIVPWVR